MGNPSQSYGASLAITGSHSVTCHPTQVNANATRLNPNQTGWYSIYLPRRGGRLS